MVKYCLKIKLLYQYYTYVYIYTPEIHKQKVKEYKKRLAEEKHQQELEQRKKILEEFKSVGFDNKLGGLNRPTLFTASKIHYSIMNGFVLIHFCNNN